MTAVRNASSLQMAITKAEHDAIVATKGRPLTQGPIKSRTMVQDAAPDHATVTDLDRVAERLEPTA